MAEQTADHTVERESVPGECTHCGAQNLRRYPVLSEGGWFMVEKCQTCLQSHSRNPWHRLGYVTRPEFGV